MPIIDMKKVYILGHRQERQKIFNLLHQMGTVELLDVKSGEAWRDFKTLLEPEQTPEELFQIDSQRSDIRFCLDFFQRHFPIRKSMIEQFTGSRLDLTDEQFSNYVEAFDQVESVHQACREAEEKLVSIRNEETQSQNLIEDLRPWASLDLPLEEVEDRNWTMMDLFIVPFENYSVLQGALTDRFFEYFLDEVFTDDEDVYFFFSALKENKQEIDELFRNKAVTRASFPDIKGTPSEIIDSLNKKLESLQQEKSIVLGNVEKLLIHRPMLMACYDYMDNEYEKHQAVDNLARTDNSFLMEGWVPVPVLNDLETMINAKTETATLATRDPEPHEQVPVLLHNKGLAEPYEVVTKLYSTPKKNELDPTPFMAPFFFLFFGICLSDAGYGILLALLALYLYRKLTLGETGRQLLKLLILGGISAFAFGILLGGYFGDLIALPPLLFDPLEEPMTMLIAALGIGLFQVYFGMGLQAYRNIKSGKSLDALYDQGFWFIFLNGLILWIAGIAFGQWIALTGAAGLILTQGRSQRSLLLKIFSGFLSLYNVTQYLSDVLSYSRLFALGLASVVIGMVVNSVGELAAGSIIGYIILVIILVIGHFFNMIISTLSSYVHTSRLQYLEFFNKFFEGGGRSFKPFRIKNNYVDIVETEKGQ